MKTPVLRLVQGSLLLLGLLLEGPASAAVINANGTWYNFYFGTSGTFGYAASDGGFPGGVAAPVSPWQFSSLVPVEIAITDAFYAGDTFSLFDNNVLMGSTPFVTPNASVDVPNPNVAILDPQFSHAFFILPPGDHSLTIRVDDSPHGLGAAYFRVTPVPESGTSALVVLGLLAIAARCRRWRSPRSDC